MPLGCNGGDLHSRQHTPHLPIKGRGGPLCTFAHDHNQPTPEIMSPDFGTLVALAKVHLGYPHTVSVRFKRVCMFCLFVNE